MPPDPPTPEHAPGRHTRDLDLARRARRGERAAVDEFLERMRCVRRFVAARNAALGRPLRPEELEDTVQNTLLALWTKLDGFTGSGSLEAWAYRFSYLELLSRLHVLRRRPRFLDDLGVERKEEQVAASAEDPFEHEQLYRALERLDEPAAGLLRAKHLEALTFEEISARERVPVNTVKTRYYRALEKLRAVLGAPLAAPLAEERP